ncbi:hypothetical protein [Streptomyces sp. NPDC101150]|uniref:hypothetical protein n=1 Tax=Streptomyces sp. NPDC101150 TaxID=3366114 RepID=UPI00382FDF0C
MPVTAALRYVRAAVFAVVCVVVSAIGHELMSGTALPVWAWAAAAVAVFGCAAPAASRERSLPVITAGVLGAQGVMHVFFSWAQGVGGDGMAMGPSAGPTKADVWAGWLLCGAHAGSADTATGDLGRSMRQVVHATGLDWNSLPTALAAHRHGGPPGPDAHPAHAMHTMNDMPAVHAMHHAGFGMLAAHLIAALICAWWLARGERTVFAVLRALAAAADRSLHRLLALFVVAVTAPVACRVPRRTRRPAAVVPPQLPRVRYAVIRRGPPLSFSY